MLIINTNANNEDAVDVENVEDVDDGPRICQWLYDLVRSISLYVEMLNT